MVLLGGLEAARLPGLLAAVTARGLRPLLVDERTPEAERLLARRAAEPGHPLAALAGVAWAGPAEPPEVVERVMEWARLGDVRGVCALREEYVETAGVAAELLGLPSPGLRATAACADRSLLRLYLEEWGPAFEVVPPGLREEAARTWAAYPVTVVPARRGPGPGPGARLARDRASLAALLARYGSGETLVLEARAEGRECPVDSLVRDGAVVRASAGGLTGDALARALDVSGRALARLDFRDGLARALFRAGGPGEVLLIEVAVLPLPLPPPAPGAPGTADLLDVALGEPGGRAGTGTR